MQTRLICDCNLVVKCQSSTAAASLYTQEFFLPPSSSSHSYSSHTFPSSPLFSSLSTRISLWLGWCAESCQSEFLPCGRNPGRPWLFCLTLTLLGNTVVGLESELCRLCPAQISSLSSDCSDFSHSLITDIITSVICINVAVNYKVGGALSQSK